MWTPPSISPTAAVTFLLGVVAVAVAVVLAVVLHRLPDRADGSFDRMIEQRHAQIWPWVRRLNTDLVTRELKVDRESWLTNDRRGQRFMTRWVMPAFLLVFGVLVATAANVPTLR